MPRRTIRATEYFVFGQELRALEHERELLQQRLHQQECELITVRTENVGLRRKLEENEIQCGQIETDLIAAQNSDMLAQDVDLNQSLHQQVALADLEVVRSENTLLRRQLTSILSEDPDDTSLAESDLKRVAKRRQLPLPDPKHRIDVRGFFQYEEVRMRWGHEDPKEYNELVMWFRGKNDKPGMPSGGQFWLDMLKTFGHDPINYDDISKNHPLKLHVEHMFCQNQMGEDSSLRNGMMNLYALEGGFNMAIEFKESNTRAKLAFFGQRTERNHRKFLRWRDTKDNRHLPSMFFLRSVHCTDQELCASRFMCSGLRSTGMSRQLRLTDVRKERQKAADDVEPRIVEV